MLFSWIVLIAEGMFSYIFKSNYSANADSICLMIIVINALAVIGEIASRKTDKNTKQILLGGFIFRLFLLVWDLKCRNIFSLPNSGADSEMFAGAAEKGYLIRDWNRGGMYARYIAFWYRFFYIQRPIAQYTNILIAFSLIIVVIRIMQFLKIKNDDQKLIVLLLSFLPNFAVVNSILLRETIIMFTTTVSVWFFVRWIHNNKIYNLFISIIVCCIGAVFHSGAIAFLLGEAIVLVLYDKQAKQIRINKNSAISIIFVIVVFLTLQSTFGDTLFTKFNKAESVEDLISINDRSSGGSAYEAGIQINNSILNLIVNTPIRMFYFIASPVPWKWRGVGDIIAFLFSAMVYLYIYYYAINELRRGNNKNKTMIIVLLILSLSTALIFAWGVSNAGTALRHREKFISIYLLLLAVARSGHTEKIGKNAGNSLKSTKVRSIS